MSVPVCRCVYAYEREHVCVYERVCFGGCTCKRVRVHACAQEFVCLSAFNDSCLLFYICYHVEVNVCGWYSVCVGAMCVYVCRGCVCRCVSV